MSLRQVGLVVEATGLPDLGLLLVLFGLFLLVVDHDAVLVVHNGVEALRRANGLQHLLELLIEGLLRLGMVVQPRPAPLGPEDLRLLKV